MASTVTTETGVHKPGFEERIAGSMANPTHRET